MDAAEFTSALAAAGVTDVTDGGDAGWRSGRAGVALEGTMLIAGQRLRFGFLLRSDFPDSFPRVYSLSENACRLPHVDRDLNVCAFENENSLLDYRNTRGLVGETVERARTVVENGLLRRNHQEFLDEFEAYWPGVANVPSAITAGSSAHAIKLSYEGSRFLALADAKEQLSEYFPSQTKQLRSGQYLVVDEQQLKPVHPTELASWRAVTSLLTAESKQFAARLRVKRDQTMPIVVGFPRPSGGRALAGLILRKFDREGSLLDAVPREAVPINLVRYDPEQLRERLPATKHAARIAIIGCGAVGGHVAHTLAWSGAHELILIDPETCRGANTYRHVLGRKGWEQSKAVGLKTELEAHVPGLKVTPFVATANSVLATQPGLLSSMDAVIVAIGNHSVPLRLNDVFAKQRLTVPVIYTWLEPYGIGGHAALVRYPKPGCLRCLFEETPDLSCTVEFAAPGQRFAQRELGCHALFTPYGDLDARSTATLAARLVESGGAVPLLHSWRGPSTQFLAAGFRLSERYEAHSNTEQPIEARRGCAACGA